MSRNNENFSKLLSESEKISLRSRRWNPNRKTKIFGIGSGFGIEKRDSADHYCRISKYELVVDNIGKDIWVPCINIFESYLWQIEREEDIVYKI